MKQTEYILHPHCVMISDLHLGSPEDDRLEDFDQDEVFERLLLKTIPELMNRQPATLIIAGDFIDFPQVLPTLSRHSWGDKYGTTQEESHVRVQKVIEGHPRVFSTLNEYVSQGGQVLLVPGNHDIDLVWPKVFHSIKQAIGAQEPQVCLVEEGHLFEKRIYIEHGNQYSFENKFMHWPSPILDAPDQRLRLERAWGTLFMDLVYNDIEDLYPFVNKLDLTSELIPIVLRSLGQKNRPSPNVLARFVAFWLLKGRRAIKERILGGKLPDSAEFYSKALPSHETVCSFIQDTNNGMALEQITEIADATLALLMNPESLPAAFTSPKETDWLDLSGQQSLFHDETPAIQSTRNVNGLLGRTNEAGLQERQINLLNSGEITIVAFGHTHEPIDGNEHCLFGSNDPRRAFNTGSWMPRLSSTEVKNSNWSWADLKEKWPQLKRQALSHDIRYLLIELISVPRGHLCSAE